MLLWLHSIFSTLAQWEGKQVCVSSSWESPGSKKRHTLTLWWKQIIKLFLQAFWSVSSIVRSDYWTAKALQFGFRLLEYPNANPFPKLSELAESAKSGPLAAKRSTRWVQGSTHAIPLHEWGLGLKLLLKIGFMMNFLEVLISFKPEIPWKEILLQYFSHSSFVLKINNCRGA